MKTYLLIIIMILINSCSYCKYMKKGGKICGDRRIRTDINDNFINLVVKAKVNGVERNLMIDTGANISAFSSKLLKEDPNNIKIENEKIDDNIYLVKSICIKGMCFEDTYVYALDSDQFSTDLKEGINGFIGMNILGDLVYQIVYDKYVILDLDDYNGDNGIIMEHGEHGRPWTSVNIDHVKNIKSLLDTGACTSIISKDVYEKIQYIDNKSNNIVSCNIYGCNKNNYMSEVNKYCVGDYCRNNFRVLYPFGFNAIGYVFFSKYITTFDFLNYKLYFENE